MKEFYDVLDEMNPSVMDILEMEKEVYEDEVDTQDGKDTEFYVGDSMSLYLAQMGQIPLLSLEEELDLGKKIEAGGEAAKLAKDKLLCANLRLVVYYAKKYRGRGVDFEDLNSMGIEGLMKAVDRYDYKLGFKFSTYASWWINQAINRGIAAEGSAVRVPVHMNENIAKVRKAKKVLYQQKGEEPTVQEIAEYTGLTEDKVINAFAAIYNVVSFDTKVGNEGDTTLESFLVDERTQNPCDTVVNDSLKEAISKVLGMLEPKEALVLSLRYGLGRDYPMTLEEVSKLPGFCVTRERIRQIEGKAIRKIKCSPKLRNLLIDYVA